jgi:hypothetical protein
VDLLLKALDELQQIAWVAEESHDAYTYERAVNAMDAINAYLTVQNESPVNAGMRLSAREDGPVLDSEIHPEPAP